MLKIVDFLYFNTFLFSHIYHQFKNLIDYSFFILQIAMKTDDKTPQQRVRIAVLGNVNVGKSGKFSKNIRNSYRDFGSLFIA